MDQAIASWDKTTEALVSFAQQSSYESLSADVVHACKLRLMDMFASALGAYDNPTSALARKVAARSMRIVRLRCGVATSSPRPRGRRLPMA